ncbi:CRISPR-associated helicase Cas3' [Azotobacter armeniacus]
MGEIARAIVSRYPPSLRTILFPEGSPLAAAGHDIGKVSPTFYEKLRRACDPSEGLPALTGIDPALEARWGGHPGVSQLAAVAAGAPAFVPEILGQHHGFSPPVAGRRAADEVFGGAAWQQERERLIAALKEALQTDWPTVGSAAQARLLAGLTSVADWIGSGEFFEDPVLEWQPRIAQALDAAGFVPPAVKPGLSFEQVFGFAPRSAQRQLIEQVATPGVYVLEAPMGLGKTEAALYAAYRILERGQACGIYFALPTQLTSNKIHERFSKFLHGDKLLHGILADDCMHRSLLLHANAWLLETEMGEEGRPGGSWFQQGKRGLLAPFAVGTLDQALMAAMNVRHGFVRAFGLAGKVVILDEIHTYDAYTGTLLDALVDLLRQLHCTVIVLSATLNRERRGQLLDCSVASADYPLITAVPAGGAPVEVAVPVSDRQRVVLRLEREAAPALNEALERAQAGQQVLWIENSVAEAQERYLDLAARAGELGVACGLLHSRFTADDRQRLEAHWVGLFGKDGWSERRRQGRILIGTQVLEQSLDIDADFLVSRFAPTDMLLQRMGRLWRHADTPRAAGACCEAWLLAPDPQAAIETPQQVFGATAAVYSPYVLCRSLEVWEGRNQLDLPGDIRALIEATYAARPETGAMARWLHELEEGSRRSQGRQALRQLARVALAEDGVTLPESKAQTRYSETESGEALLLRNLLPLSEQQASRLTLLNGEQVLLPWQQHRLNKREWRRLAALLMRQVVKVRLADAPLPVPLDTLRKLGFQHCFYLGRPGDDEALLRVALLDESGELHGLQGARMHDRHSLGYRDDLGYRLLKDCGCKAWKTASI